MLDMMEEPTIDAAKKIEAQRLPDDIAEIRRMPTGHGWSLWFDGEEQACFSSIADLCSYVSTAFRPLDIAAGIIPREEPMRPIPAQDLPKVLAKAQEIVARKPASFWRVFKSMRPT